MTQGEALLVLSSEAQKRANAGKSDLYSILPTCRYFRIVVAGKSAVGVPSPSPCQGCSFEIYIVSVLSSNIKQRGQAPPVSYRLHGPAFAAFPGFFRLQRHKK